MKGMVSVFYLAAASYLVFCVSMTTAFSTQRHWIAARFLPHESSQGSLSRKQGSNTQLRAVYELPEGADFKEVVLNSKTPVVVDFYADWCGPCKMMGPVFDKLSNEMTDVKFIKVNSDHHSDILAHYKVRGIPTFAVFVNGQNVAQQAGAMGHDGLKNFITRARQSGNP